jgi:hypothetical protein
VPTVLVVPKVAEAQVDRLVAPEVMLLVEPAMVDPEEVMVVLVVAEY